MIRRARTLTCVEQDHAVAIYEDADSKLDVCEQRDILLGVSSATHGTLIVQVLENSGLPSELDVGTQGFPASVVVALGSAAEDYIPPEVVRQVASVIDPRSQQLRFNVKRAESVRLGANRAFSRWRPREGTSPNDPRA